MEKLHPTMEESAGILRVATNRALRHIDKKNFAHEILDLYG